ncbi:hypothetical protein ACQJBY_073027 [Aegilops geniculata]
MSPASSSPSRRPPLPFLGRRQPRPSSPALPRSRASSPTALSHQLQSFIKPHPDLASTTTMSSEIQGVGGSSAASIAAPTPAKVVDSDDPAWKYCALIDANKKHWLKCNFCDKICTSGVTRIKFHLSQIRNCGVIGCPKVPSDVRLEMIALLLKSAELKEKEIEGLEALRTSVDLDHSDGENQMDEDDGNQVVVFRSKPNTNNSRGGPMDKFCKPSIEETVKRNQKRNCESQNVQSKASTQKREERGNKACEYICQFSYEASISHNTVTLPSFLLMIEAIIGFGPDLDGPTHMRLVDHSCRKGRGRCWIHSNPKF